MTQVKELVGNGVVVVVAEVHLVPWRTHSKADAEAELVWVEVARSVVPAGEAEQVHRDEAPVYKPRAGMAEEDTESYCTAAALQAESDRKKNDSWLEAHSDMAVVAVGKSQRAVGETLVGGKDNEGEGAPHAVQDACHRDESHEDDPHNSDCFDQMMAQVRTLAY